MTKVSIILGDGSTRHGHYMVKNGMVTVHFAGFKETTQLGGMPPDQLAMTILAEFPKAA